MERKFKLAFYFSLWIFLAAVATILNILNIDFSKTHYITAIFLMLALAVIQGSVLEYPVQTIACLIIGGWRREVPKAETFTKTLLMNYNLLACTEAEIDECVKMMFEAYMGNLSYNISAVLVSAARNEELKEYELSRRDYYRHIIFNTLYCEGLSFAYKDTDLVNTFNYEHIWSRYDGLEPLDFIQNHLSKVCNKFVYGFMVIHRFSRVLRKCGQYQDLMLLSSGDRDAYTYCDEKLYSNYARQYGEPLFYDSKDVRNILGKGYDYTLVLDADTEVPEGTAYELLLIAEEHPDRGIIQPAINMQCTKHDSIFMNLEYIRQTVNEPLTNSKAAIFEQSSYFGKSYGK